MKQMIKTRRRTRKGIAAILVAVMLLTLLPASTASAAEIESGIPTITPNISTATGTTVGFGGQEWYVIGDGTSGVYKTANGAPADSVTLLHKSTGARYEAYGEITFRAYNGILGVYEGSYINQSDYNDSILANYLNDSNVLGTFSTEEQNLINPRTLTTADGIGGDNADDQKLWALSYDEWDAINDNTVRSYGYLWWLRSPDGNNKAFNVSPLGSSSFGILVEDTIRLARPAFNLNLKNVIFTSAAVGGKSTVAAGSGFVDATTTPLGAKIKFTMKDASQKLDPVSMTSPVSPAPTKTLKFDYTGATTGTNQYVSAVLKKSGADEVVYYAKLKGATSNASDTVEQALTGVPDGNYTLEIFSEQANDENNTDFCSAVQTFNLTIGNSLSDSKSDSGSPNTGDGINLTGLIILTAGSALLLIAGILLLLTRRRKARA